MPPPTPSPELAALIRFYEHLTPAALPHLAQLYRPEARFKDPFNDVRGTVAITHIFEHMFIQLEAPRFVVLSQVQQGRQAWLTWDFHFKLRGKPFTIHGASHLQLADDGRVLQHRDYWDAAEELYAKLPFLGGLMRWLQRRLAAG